ncbi:Nn.00g059890.m01.CDS01 [Neocucurbitaria sp. VM-36]
MSGIEVVAAVSAVISAFHGGSELLKHIKAKRRTRKLRDQAQQEFEEKQLQDSLVTGEQQIGLRYMQDMRELGDLMRVGDVVARDRLFHIAITLQAEVIKSLQMACQHEAAVLNLRLLHEASIMNRKDTFVTLDELKQRILITRPMARQIKGAPEGSMPRHSTASVQTVLTNNYSPVSHIPDNYIPQAVTLPSQGETQEPKHGLTEYFRLKRKNSTSTSQMSNTSAQAADINFSEALEQLVRSRGSEDRSVIMKDIDEMISSYQGLHVTNQENDSWGNNKYNGGYGGSGQRLSQPDGDDAYQHSTMGLNRDGAQRFNNLPPTPEEYRAVGKPGYPAPFHNTLDPPLHDPHLYSQQYAAKIPFPHMQTQMGRSRWSDVSASSSTLSDAASLNRNSSSSSQDSNTNTSLLPVDFPSRPLNSGLLPRSAHHNAIYQHHDEERRVQSPPFAPYAQLEENYPSPIAPLVPQRVANQTNASPQSSPRLNSPADAPPSPQEAVSSPVHKPWPGSLQHRDSFPLTQYAPPKQYAPSTEEEQVDVIKSMHPQYQPGQLLSRDNSSLHSSKSERTITPSGFAAVAAAATTLGTAPALAGLRHASIAASIASTDSSGSGSIGILPGPRMRNTILTDTIQSGPAGQEKMMDGRPCKDNNYWGFCKGAWAVREELKKGLAVRTQPSGMYNTKQIWECTACTFKGDTFTIPHPTKKNKTETVVDQRVHISMAGIRYRWIFLAKSHVKKKPGDSFSEESNYGCVLCCVEGNLTGVYGGVETLMNHIALTHVADMSDKTRKKVNCILGRVAGPGEAWDLNVPIFAQVEELAG